ncbi:MAG: 2-amino-4-hydroxy-6-hydroxymethyldihydropteridine diphosphokinase [Thermotaleaceae bacterium]
MAKVFLGLGSNMGDKKANLDTAIQLLGNTLSIEILKLSSYYETEPVGYIEQDCFLNRVIEIETSLTPMELLKCCNGIEHELKRKRDIRWGPRTIDIDILIFENYSSKDEVLTIPHPRMEERAFVMIPLYEIRQDLILNGKPIVQIVEALGEEGIRKIEDRE